MPTVLITGLNGYTAPHTAALFLKNGWHVRGTVRTTEKAQKVKELPVFAEAVQNGTLQTFVVDSLAKGDFSQALAGVDAVSVEFLAQDTKPAALWWWLIVRLRTSPRHGTLRAVRGPSTGTRLSRGR